VPAKAAVELHRSAAGRSEDTHQFRSRVESDTEGEDFVLWAAYPNPVVLDPAPALSDDTLLQQVLIPLNMPMPDAGLERAGHRFLTGHLQQHLSARLE
jgi:hypothetical protein